MKTEMEGSRMEERGMSDLIETGYRLIDRRKERGRKGKWKKKGQK